MTDEKVESAKAVKRPEAEKSIDKEKDVNRDNCGCGCDPPIKSK